MLDLSIIQNIIDQNIERYEKMIDEKVKDKKKAQALKKSLRERYWNMVYHPGEAIGVVASQSISEPATQTTLRSYHRVAGAGLITTQGLPRIIEIFDARKTPKTPSMKIYLEKEYNNKEDAKRIASLIRETRLKQVMEEDYLDLTDLAIEITLSKKQMKALDLTGESIAKSLRKVFRNIEVKVVDDQTLRIESTKQDVTLVEIQKIRLRMREAHVKGIKGIEQCVVEKEGDEYVLYTLGSNLQRVAKIPGVDFSRTTTNNIHEIEKTFGIEAARQAIVNETLSTLRAQGVDTDVRHVLLVADMMTAYGEVQAIGRYGVSGAKASVLARANFEETVRHLTDAAVAGEEDHLNGIVENIIVGKTARVGTGTVELVARFPPIKKKEDAKKKSAKKEE